jgi:peptidoglycan hydrolase-like protein with peptidoglycan-binding domain
VPSAQGDTASTGASQTHFELVTSSTPAQPDQTSPTAGTSDGSGQTAQTLTALAATGQDLAAGDVLFAIDNRPAVMMLGTDAAYRDLTEGVDDGPDIAQLGDNLAALGFTADGQLTADQHFDAATTAAVEDWQSSLGVQPTGTVELGDVVFLPDPVTVVAANGAVGDPVQAGAHLLDVTGETLLAVAGVPVRILDEVAAGTPATITLADGTTVTGAVRAVGDDATRAADTPVEESTVEVTVQLDATDSPSAVDFADVTLAVTTATRNDVLTVPVAAIVDDGDGKTAVHVPSDDADRLVTVDAGLAAGGYVEITEGALAEGDPVLLPGPDVTA